MPKFTAEFEEWLQKAKNNLRPEKQNSEESKAARHRIDTSHFDRLSPEQKKQIHEYAIHAAKTKEHGTASY